VSIVRTGTRERGAALVELKLHNGIKSINKTKGELGMKTIKQVEQVSGKENKLELRVVGRKLQKAQPIS